MSAKYIIFGAKPGQVYCRSFILKWAKKERRKKERKQDLEVGFKRDEADLINENNLRSRKLSKRHIQGVLL